MPSIALAGSVIYGLQSLTSKRMTMKLKINQLFRGRPWISFPLIQRLTNN